MNDALPEGLRDYSREMDKDGMKAVFTLLAQRYPGRYKEIAQQLQDLGRHVAYSHGPASSISLRDLEPVPGVREAVDRLRSDINDILDSNLEEEQKQDKIVNLVGGVRDKLRDLVYKSALAFGNVFARQVKAGARGTPVQLTSMLLGDILSTDHKDRPVPIPLLSGYSEGVTPAEYWAASYGTRKGAVATKFMTPKGGFFGKQIALAAHRLAVTEKDCETKNGILVDVDDMDSEGAVLRKAVGGFKAGTIVTPMMLKELKRKGTKEIYIRSPMTCQARSGVCQKCTGVREKGDFPSIGDNVGMVAAHAVSEPVSQMQMRVKHTGAASGATGAGTSLSGFKAIDQLIQVPKAFKGGAAVAQVDGRVEGIAKAPQGGQYVTVRGEQHWVPPDTGLKVRVGSVVEAGDVLSDGVPNPAEIVKHKGIGEGRRYFVEVFQNTLRENGVKANRRNVELVTRGLINHVRMVDEDGSNNALPDDIVEYDEIVKGYAPRHGAKFLPPKRAVGSYLEQPALHYSIGTRITPRVARNLNTQGVKGVLSHTDLPSFVPEMKRAMESLSHAGNWLTRMGAVHGLKSNLLESVHRGRGAELHGTSFIPALAEPTSFGQVPGKVY